MSPWTEGKPRRTEMFESKDSDRSALITTMHPKFLKKEAIVKVE
jgi:hypothetical protein